MVHDDDEIDTDLCNTIIDECPELEADGSNAICKSCSDSIGITVPIERASDDKGSEPDGFDPTHTGVMLDLPAIELQGPMHCECIAGEVGSEFRRIVCRALASRLVLQNNPDYLTKLDAFIECEIDGVGEGDYGEFITKCTEVGVSEDILDLSKTYHPPSLNEKPKKRVRVDDGEDDSHHPSPPKKLKTVE